MSETETSNPESGPGGLNEAASVGIGVGVGVGVILLALGCWVLYRRGGKKKRRYLANDLPAKVPSHTGDTRDHHLPIEMSRQPGDLYVEPVSPDHDQHAMQLLSPGMKSRLPNELPV